MNNNKKRGASRRVPLLERSIVLLDPKAESFAVMRDKAKKNLGGVPTINPFVVLPSLEKLRSKWFSLCVATAINGQIKKQRTEGNERRQRKSQRAD